MSTKNKLLFVWLYVDPDTMQPTQRTWIASGRSNMVSGATIGCVYRFERAKNGNIYTGRKYRELLQNVKISAEKLIEWEAGHVAARTEKQQIDTEKKYAKDKHKPLQAHVTALRDAYYSVTPSQRAAFLAWLIQGITKHVRSERN